MLLRRLLTYVGLRAAPSPIRRYAAPAGTFGVVPVLAFVAWKNRETIKSTFQKLTARGQSATAGQGTSTTSTRSTSTPYSASTLS